MGGNERAISSEPPSKIESKLKTWESVEEVGANVENKTQVVFLTVREAEEILQHCEATIKSL